MRDWNFEKLRICFQVFIALKYLALLQIDTFK